jgi:hypothetical protein
MVESSSGSRMACTSRETEKVELEKIAIYDISHL